MRAVFVAALVFGVVSGTTGTLAAGQQPPKKDIFANLFINPQKPAPMPPPATLTPPWAPVTMTVTKRNVTTACGLTVIQADPDIDRAMPRPMPNAAAQSAIRTIPATDCGK